MNNIRALLLTLALALTANVASADVVTFTVIDDSHNASGIDSRELWDLGLTGPSGDKVLDIGVTDFFADGNLGGININAFDTLTLTIETEPGYVITKITYDEGGTRTLGAGGIALYTGSASANGQSNALGFNLFQGASNGSWDTDALFEYDISDGVNFVDFSVTNSLTAVGDALIAKTGASITVETAFVPVPPAIWMMGSALLGLVAVRRKRA